MLLRMAESGRIRVYDEPVASGDKSGARRKAFRSQPFARSRSKSSQRSCSLINA